jgi:patatin-like phospholipase/acyl hydrolase
VDDLLGGLDLSGGGGLAMAHAQTPTQTPPQQHMGFAHPQMQQQMMQQQMMQQQMVQQNMMQQNMMRQNMVQQNMVQQNTTRPNTTHPQTAPSRGRGGPMSDAALGGGQSRYTQKKDVSAFDFVTDLLGTERKK